MRSQAVQMRDPSGESVPGVQSDEELRGSQECCPLRVLSITVLSDMSWGDLWEKSQPKSESQDLNLN